MPPKRKRKDLEEELCQRPQAGKPLLGGAANCNKEDGKEISEDEKCSHQLLSSVSKTSMREIESREGEKKDAHISDDDSEIQQPRLKKRRKVMNDHGEKDSDSQHDNDDKSDPLNDSPCSSTMQLCTLGNGVSPTPCTQQQQDELQEHHRLPIVTPGVIVQNVSVCQ